MRIWGYQNKSWQFFRHSKRTVRLVWKIAFEINLLFLVRAIGNRLGIEPVNQCALDRMREEVIPGWTIVSDEVASHVVLDGYAEVTIVREVRDVHVEAV